MSESKIRTPSLSISLTHSPTLSLSIYLSLSLSHTHTHTHTHTHILTHSLFQSFVYHVSCFQIIEVKNGISVASDFTIDKIIQFGGSGPKPRVCTEMTVEGQSGLLYYQDLFKEKKMKKYLKMKEPWTFSW